MEVLQDGRFVVGTGAVLARHRDTLLSVLSGVQFPGRRASAELKVGLSLLFGTPRREAHQYDDPGGTVALTTGADFVMPVNERFAVVPSVRYSFAIRGGDALYFGLGDHIIRLGVGIRALLTR